MRRSFNSGFSLIELLVTIGIVAVLIAILLPIIARVRAASRTTYCLANLQQWGQLYHTYLSVNRGQMPPPPNGNDPHHQEWWEFLAGANEKSTANLICPEATAGSPRLTVPRNIARGSAHSAWEALRRLVGRTFSSYGLNTYVFSHVHQSLRPFGVTRLPWPAEIPLLGDCCTPRPGASNGDGIPTNFEQPSPGGGDAGVGDFCINRHGMAVNIVFIDGHAETVPLAGLWKLRWSEKFTPKAVTLVSPG